MSPALPEAAQIPHTLGFIRFGFTGVGALWGLGIFNVWDFLRKLGGHSGSREYWPTVVEFGIKGHGDTSSCVQIVALTQSVITYLGEGKIRIHVGFHTLTTPLTGR